MNDSNEGCMNMEYDGFLMIHFLDQKKRVQWIFLNSLLDVVAFYSKTEKYAVYYAFL